MRRVTQGALRLRTTYARRRLPHPTNAHSLHYCGQLLRTAHSTAGLRLYHVFPESLCWSSRIGRPAINRKQNLDDAIRLCSSHAAAAGLDHHFSRHTGFFRVIFQLDWPIFSSWVNAHGKHSVCAQHSWSSSSFCLCKISAIYCVSHVTQQIPTRLLILLRHQRAYQPCGVPAPTVALHAAID